MEAELINAFCEAAMLNSNSSTWNKRRKEGTAFANVVISGPGHNFGSHWQTWWEPFIGLEILAMLQFSNGKLQEAYPVRLSSKRIVIGRGICPSAVTIT